MHFIHDFKHKILVSNFSITRLSVPHIPTVSKIFLVAVLAMSYLVTEYVMLCII